MPKNNYILIHGQLVDVSDDELKHYGILGMKWGIRRYQNKGDTLTTKGKTRHNTEEQDTFDSDGYMIPAKSSRKDMIEDYDVGLRSFTNSWADLGKSYVENMPLFNADIVDIDFDSIPSAMPTYKRK